MTGCSQDRYTRPALTQAISLIFVFDGLCCCAAPAFHDLFAFQFAHQHHRWQVPCIAPDAPAGRAWPRCLPTTLQPPTTPPAKACSGFATATPLRRRPARWAEQALPAAASEAAAPLAATLHPQPRQCPSHTAGAFFMFFSVFNFSFAWFAGLGKATGQAGQRKRVCRPPHAGCGQGTTAEHGFC